MDAPAYFEIQSDQPEQAVRFYSAVFGWKFVRALEIPIDYWRIETAGIRGGLLKRPAPTPPTGTGTNAYVVSMEVADFDSTAKLVLQNGGTIALPKFAVPGVCYQGYFLDPDSNTFGIFEANPDAR